MTNIGAGVMIGASCVARGLEDKFGSVIPPLEQAAEVAMGLCLKDGNCFMCRSDDEKFKSGIGGLFLFYKNDPDTKTRIETEMRALQAFSALMSGVPVRIEDVVDEEFKAIGFLSMFRKAQGINANR